MELDKKDKQLLESALAEWEHKKLIDSEKAKELASTIQLKQSGTQIARYFFVIAIACTLLAFSAIFIDDKLLEKIKAYFDVSNLIIAISCTIIAAIWFAYLAKKRKSFNSMVYEVYMVLGGLVSVSALVYYCKDIGFGPEYSGFLITTSIMFFALSIVYRSYTLWAAALLALMGWYGAYSYHLNNDDNLFFGMNYPMRFTVFGLVIIVISLLQKAVSTLKYTQRQTYIIGLLIFFTGLWGVSVFGNYGHFDEWEQVRQVQIIGYAIVMALFSVGALLYGIKYDDDVTRDFGILFILLNLYSRYFEYFWDTTNKGLFFLILAISFAVLGWWIESSVRRKKRLADSNSVPE